MIAEYRSLPHEVPAGGAGLLLLADRLCEDALRGPGPLPLVPGEADAGVVFVSTRLRMQFDVDDLFSTEGVQLGLTVRLAVHIHDPLAFYVDVLGRSPAWREMRRFHEDDLCAFLQELVPTCLRPALAQATLHDLYGDPQLRAWLEGALQEGLREVDLAGRSGLMVESLEAFDVHCAAFDQEQQAREKYYLRTSLETMAADRPILDERILAALDAVQPAEEPLDSARAEPASQPEPEGSLARVRRMLHRPPSILRPEIWRCTLDEPVRTEPLCHEDCVFVAAESGRVYAYAAQDGTPLWRSPAELGAHPADRMAVAANLLWIPGHDGTLYGLQPEDGRVVHRVQVGGRLSSGPLVAGPLLYLSVDVSRERFDDAATGHVVVVDARRGQVMRSYPVSRRGLRAAPALLGDIVLAGDTRGQLSLVHLADGEVSSIDSRGGRIAGAACVDRGRQQFIVGDSYGRLRALDRGGHILWESRPGSSANSTLIGSPLLHNGALYVGSGDGNLYALDPVSGREVHPPFAAKGPIVTRPVAWRRLVFVGANDGYLYAVHAGSGERFWQYHSGNPITSAPAIGENGRLFVVDSAGNLNALQWCLTQYAAAVRMVLESQPQRWEEAVDLWLQAGDAEAALEIAERARRTDLVAEIAWDLQWYDKAAGALELLARKLGSSPNAANFWRRAGQAWGRHQQEERANECMLAYARSAGVPRLALAPANQPAVTVGEEALLQVTVRNLTDVLAYDVRITCTGHVQQGDSQYLHTLGPNAERWAQIRAMPSQSGSATVRLTLTYADAHGRRQAPVVRDIRLVVNQPPTVQTIYQGPVINGEGVIIMRGETGRHIQVSGEQAVAGGEFTEGTQLCPQCGRPTAIGVRCDQCGAKLGQ